MIMFLIFNNIDTVKVLDTEIKLSGTMGGNYEKEFLFRFAPGDKVIINVKALKGDVSDFYVYDYISDNLIFEKHAFKEIKEELVNSSNDTVFWSFYLKNSAVFSGKIYRLIILRIPKNQSLNNFRTYVKWKTVAETTWVDAYDTLWDVVYDTIPVIDTIVKDTIVSAINEIEFRLSPGWSNECSKNLYIQLPNGFIESQIYILVTSGSSSLRKLVEQVLPIISASQLGVPINIPLSSGDADIKLSIYFSNKGWIDYGRVKGYKFIVGNNSELIDERNRINLYFDNCYSVITSKYIKLIVKTFETKRKYYYKERQAITTRKVIKDIRKYKKPIVRKYKVPY